MLAMEAREVANRLQQRSGGWSCASTSLTPGVSHEAIEQAGCEFVSLARQLPGRRVPAILWKVRMGSSRDADHGEMRPGAENE
jgi:hypothetical protein